jgi:hypothetical protein
MKRGASRAAGDCLKFSLSLLRDLELGFSAEMRANDAAWDCDRYVATRPCGPHFTVMSKALVRSLGSPLVSPVIFKLNGAAYRLEAETRVGAPLAPEPSTRINLASPRRPELIPTLRVFTELRLA